MGRGNLECKTCSCPRFRHVRGRGSCNKCGRCRRFISPDYEADKPPLTDAELAMIDQGWQQGWDQEFPGQPYPGLVEARRLIRMKLWGQP